MKNSIPIILFLTLLTSCAPFRSISPGAGIDPALLGSWTGSEKGHQWEGVERHWVHHRFDDGTFIILFMAIDGDEVTPSVERGKWWTSEGVFYERFESGRTDSYYYEFISSNILKFSAKKLESPADNPDYIFIERRLD